MRIGLKKEAAEPCAFIIASREMQPIPCEEDEGFSKPRLEAMLQCAGSERSAVS